MSGHLVMVGTVIAIIALALIFLRHCHNCQKAKSRPPPIKKTAQERSRICLKSEKRRLDNRCKKINKMLVMRLKKITNDSTAQLLDSLLVYSNNKTMPLSKFSDITTIDSHTIQLQPKNKVELLQIKDYIDKLRLPISIQESHNKIIIHAVDKSAIKNHQRQNYLVFVPHLSQKKIFEKKIHHSLIHWACKKYKSAVTELHINKQINQKELRQSLQYKDRKMKKHITFFQKI